jgi:hypothetical protein
LAVVPDLPGLPSAEELSALSAVELAVRLAEAYRLPQREDPRECHGRRFIGRVV